MHLRTQLLIFNFMFFTLVYVEINQNFPFMTSNVVNTDATYLSAYTTTDPPTRNESIFDHYILFLRMYHGAKQIFYDDFFDTLKFFWPFKIIPLNLLIVLDNENELDHAFEFELRDKFEIELSNEIEHNLFTYWITFESPNPTIYNNSGWNRQQWSMFWCDKFLDRLNISKQFTYVGFVDTDTLFTSLVTPETIFHNATNIQNPKPILIAQLGFSNGFHRLVSKNTAQWFGKTELFRHMCQFPATYKISHIKDFRDRTIKYWFPKRFKMYHFDTIVQLLMKTPPYYHGVNDTHIGAKFFSQFTIFMTHAWYYAQNEYEWYFEPGHIKGKQWMVRKNYLRINGSKHDVLNFSSPESNIHDGTKESMVRISLHERYHLSDKKDIMQQGYCFCIQWRSQFCHQLNQQLNIAYGINIYLFSFEFSVDVWAKGSAFQYQSLRAQNKYYQHVQQILANHNHCWRKHPLIENNSIIN